MPLMAVTRLRLQSYRFLVPFLWQAWESFRQAKPAAGRFSRCMQTETPPYQYVSVAAPSMATEAAELKRDRRPLS